jgi:ankyrin repeat protein
MKIEGLVYTVFEYLSIELFSLHLTSKDDKKNFDKYVEILSKKEDIIIHLLELKNIDFSFPLIKLMINRKLPDLKINHISDSGTALHFLTGVKREGKEFQLIKYLLENGADPNIKNNMGQTALHYAIEIYTMDTEYILNLVKLLVKYNADVNLIDCRQLNALNYATGAEYFELVKYLVPLTKNLNNLIDSDESEMKPHLKVMIKYNVDYRIINFIYNEMLIRL